MKTQEYNDHHFIHAKAITEAIPDPVYAKDLECRFIFVNSALVQLARLFTKVQLIGKSVSEIVSTDSAKKIVEDDRRVMRTGQTKTFEESVTFPTGEKRIFLTTKSPHRDANGRIIGLIGISRDITEKRQMEEDLKLSEERLRRIFEQSPYSTQLLSADGRTVGVNPAWKKLWKFDQATIDNFIFKEYRILEDQQLIDKGIMPYILRGFNGEVTAIPPILYDPQQLGRGGRARWVEGYVYPVMDSNGKTQEVVFTHIDVTDRKHAEDALRESEARYRILIEGSPEIIFVTDLSTRMLYANHALEEQTGYTVANLQMPLAENRFIHPEDTERVTKFIADFIEGGRQYSDRIESRFVGKEGRIFWYSSTLSRTTDQGQPALQFVTYNISARKEAEEKTLQAEQESERLLIQERKARLEVECAKWRSDFLSEAGRILTTSLDYDSTLRQVAQLAVPSLADWCAVGLPDANGNIHLLVVADHSKTELARELERYIPHVDGPDGIAKVIHTGEALLYSEMTQVQPFPDGDGCHLETIRKLDLKSVMAVPLLSRGNVLGAIMMASTQKLRRYNSADLDLAKELADRCSIALENARLYRDAQIAIQLRDDFLSIASHELNTPLTSLSLQIQLINRMAEKGELALLSQEKATALLAISRRQLERFSILINNLLDASRISAGRLTLNIEPVELSDLLRQLVERFNIELLKIGSKVSVHAETLIFGSWDRMRIEQVITNLLSNAMKYAAGKPIEIAAVVEKDIVRITFQDHGIGISKEDQARIFDRFERAASPRSYGGLGLGLYITRQIVEAHGGKVSVESELNHGARFIVELPGGNSLPK